MGIIEGPGDTAYLRRIVIVGLCDCGNEAGRVAVAHEADRAAAPAGACQARAQRAGRLARRHQAIQVGAAALKVVPACMDA